MFVLDEMYETQAGLDNHWKIAVEGWEDMPVLIECKAVSAHNGVAIQGLWQGLPRLLQSIAMTSNSILIR